MPSNLSPLQHLVPTLQDDVKLLLQQIDKDPADVTRRSLVRAVFSYIEATLHAMKDAALDAHEQKHMIFSAADLAMLREETYFIDDRGVAKSRSAFSQTPANIRFTIAKFGESTFSPYRVVGSEEDWATLSDSISLRNRLVHPKRLEDLSISDAEQAALLKTFAWFQRNFNLALADALCGLRNELSRREGSAGRLLFTHERKP
jgi:hypothetical protein